MKIRNKFINHFIYSSFGIFSILFQLDPQVNKGSSIFKYTQDSNWVCYLMLLYKCSDSECLSISFKSIFGESSWVLLGYSLKENRSKW